MEGLKSRGERKDNLMTNLSKAYHTASDTYFTCYIQTKKDCYNDGEDITPEKLTT